MVTGLKKKKRKKKKLANGYHATGTVQVWGHVCAQNKNTLFLHRSRKSLHKAIYCFKPGYLLRKKRARYQENIEDGFQAEKQG